MLQNTKKHIDIQPHDTDMLPDDLVRELMWLCPADRHTVIERVTGNTRKRVLYSEDVIQILGIGHLQHPNQRLNDLMKSGELPRRKIRGRLIFRPEEIERVISDGTLKRSVGRPRKTHVRTD